MKLIIESHRPKYAIATDERQWLLYTQKPKSGWSNPTFHPNITSVLDALFEHLVRKKVKPHSGWEGLDRAVSNAYKTISSIARRLKNV